MTRPFLQKGLSALKLGGMRFGSRSTPLPPICRCNVFARSPADSVICKSEKRSKTESSVSYYEINCARGTSRITQSIDCNFEGEVITQLDHESGKWTRPFPDSVGEGLNKLFCKRGN